MNIKDIEKYNKIENNIKIVKIAEGKIIHVKKYLASDQKMAFVIDIVNRCVDGGRVIPVSVDIVTYMNFVIYYSDLEIDLEEKSIFEVYDILVQSNVLRRILEVIPEEELDAMVEYVKESIENEISYASSIAGGIGEMTKVIAEASLPGFIEAVKENPEMLEEPKEEEEE
ncbi:MAG: hypothetical protein KQ78_01860 [Candidatus Izimaplasma bacterium HR2]|nr:MAG: hypothetical protein KQ78_01860 [Candidatus Izimaplasma bacterium HR2]